MKTYLTLIIAIIVCSCSNSGSNNGSNNGLGKPITATLTVDELKANIKGNSEFSKFYEGMQEVRDWVLMNELNQAKYGDITYDRLWKYGLRLRDTAFIARIRTNIRAEYDLKYPDYTAKVDSIMTYWQNYLDEHKLENYVKIEFKELDKEYYSYSSDVRDVNIGFKITPLKGPIQQLIFSYNIKPKIKDNKEFDIIDSNSCLASSPINSAKTLYWSANYKDEKYLKYMSTAEVKRDYDFLFKIVEVRVGNKNIDEFADMVPHSVHMALNYTKELYLDDIIKEFIDKDYIPFTEFSTKKWESEIRPIDTEVYDLLKAFLDYQQKVLNDKRELK